MNKSLLIWASAIILLVVSGYVVYSVVKSDSANAQSPAQSERQAEPTAEPSAHYTSVSSTNPEHLEIDIRWVKGNPEGDIQIVKFSDFQCPACNIVRPHLDRIVNERDDVYVVYKHFPLRGSHMYALPAAQAAEAAGRQGNFWDMHNKIFADQSQWSRETGQQVMNRFRRYASELDLNSEQFEADMLSDEVMRIVMNDQQEGGNLGVRSVPGVFVNGKTIPNYRIYNDFLNAVLEHK